MSSKKKFVDEDWSRLSKKQIYSQIESELEADECEEKGHDWRNHIYCFRCGNEFQEYKNDIQRKTAFAIIAEDLRQLLDYMIDEKKFIRNNADELYNGMLRLSLDRGYWTSPKQSKEKEKMKMRQDEEVAE